MVYNSFEQSFDYLLDLKNIIDILNEAKNGHFEELDQIIQNIDNHDNDPVFNNEEPFKDFFKNILNLKLEQNRSVHNILSQHKSQVSEISIDYNHCNLPDNAEEQLDVQYLLTKYFSNGYQYFKSTVLMQNEAPVNGISADCKYSVKEIVLLAIASDNNLTEKYNDILFNKNNLSLLPILVGDQKYTEIFKDKFDSLYQSLKNKTIQFVGGKIGFFSAIALKNEKVFNTLLADYVPKYLREILSRTSLGYDEVCSILEVASSVQNIELIKIVLDSIKKIEEDKEVRVQPGIGSTLLHFATQFNRLETVEILFHNKFDINANDDNGKTPLHLAISDGHLNVATFLLRHNANIEAQDKNNARPLHFATKKESLDLLLGKEANIDAQNNDGHTLLHLAASKGLLSIIEYLASKDACLYLKDNNGKTALELANDNSKSDVVKFLIKIKDKNGYTLLHHAVKDDNLTLVDFLIVNDADVYAKDNDGKAPLHIAAECGHKEIVSCLVKTMSHAATKTCFTVLETTKDLKGRTPLHLAAQNGHLETVQSISYNVNLNIEDNDQKIPLELANDSGKLEVVQFLAREKGSSGYTSLHYAVATSNFGLVNLLIIHGAGIDVQYKNKTALELAIALVTKGSGVDVKKKKKEIVNLLTGAYNNVPQIPVVGNNSQNVQHKQEILTIVESDDSSDIQNVKIEPTVHNAPLTLNVTETNDLPQSSSVLSDLANEEKNIRSPQIQAGGNIQHILPTIEDDPITEETTIDPTAGDIHPTLQAEPLITVSINGINSQIQTTVDNIKRMNNDQLQTQTSSTRKIIYGIMIATPFIAAGIYAAVAFSAGIVEFNPLIAGAIFAGVAVAAIAYFTMIKMSEKVSEEKAKNSIGTWTALGNVLTPECLKNNEVKAPSSC